MWAFVTSSGEKDRSTQSAHLRDSDERELKGIASKFRRDPLMPRQWRCCFKLGTWCFATEVRSTIRPEGSGTVNPLLDLFCGSSSYHRQSHRSGSQPHWPSIISRPTRRARNLRPPPSDLRPRTRCSISSVAPKTTGLTEPPAPAFPLSHTPALPFCPPGIRLIFAAMYRTERPLPTRL
ncbi:hypothetical protein N658DRAFT_93237 [Parathielavia hyrcaniae]|uniref:Uncharacterized protein n=1 Tax=Parathielavia hyrcaniae TaxID=113614 RepID=A0AAN6PZG9_9PEZI|nr:hypothetical protein N658DRAFT_93237 [Parathielavia hyrcaniae]